MHSAHTYGPGRVHSAVSQRTPCNVVVVPGGVVGHVVVRTGCVTAHVACACYCVVTPSGPKIVSRPKPCLAPCRARTTPYRSTVSQCTAALSQRCITALLRHIATQRSPPATIQTIVSQLTPWLGHARVHYRTPLRASGPCRGVVSQGLQALSWPPCCTPLHPVSRYNPLYRDSDLKMGSSLSSFLPKKIFFTHFFFHFVPPTGRPQKKNKNK